MADPKLNLPPSLREAMATRDTGEVRKPGLPVLKTADPQINAWAAKLKEIVDVQSGAAGNKWEKLVTVRDIKDVGMMAAVLQAQPKDIKPGDIVLNLGGGLSATISVDSFAKSILDHPLYKDLVKRLDDPSRFDNIPREVREIVLKSIADEALTRGAAIKELSLKHDSLERSLAIWGRETTAAIRNAAAGVRNLEWATAETNFAQAGKLTQLEASLGNYYQDGTPGRASLESEMTVTADRVTGLRSQYTLKVQAGGALAGYGIAATEVDGVPSSAFIIQADKFAIVSPSYVGGLNASPPVETVPFGVDAGGIYMNTNVYIKGTMRVDTGGKTLIDGLRGSVNINATNSFWSDTTARQAVWAALGKTGSATNNNHLVIGDQVMISSFDGAFSQAKMWNGSSWITPGVVVNGSMVVDGSLSATKIDTRGLTIKDASGNVIFSSGVPLSVGRVSGLGALATQDFTWVNNLRWSNSAVVSENQLASTNNPIRPENVSTFFSGAIIDTAYIKYNAVDTLRVAGGSVTTIQKAVPTGGMPKTLSAGHSANYMNINIYVPDGDVSGHVFVCLINGIFSGANGTIGLTITDTIHGGLQYTGTSFFDGFATVAYCTASIKLSPGWHGVYVQLDVTGGTFQFNSGSLIAFGGLR